MRRGWRVLAGWGLLLCALASVQAIFTPVSTELALLMGGGGSCIVVGLLALGGERWNLPPRPDGDDRPLADLSTGAPLLGIGLALFFLGWELGPWLMAMGGGTAIIGLGNLVRELRAERRGP